MINQTLSRLRLVLCQCVTAIVALFAFLGTTPATSDQTQIPQACTRGDETFLARTYQTAIESYSKCLVSAKLSDTQRAMALNNRAHAKINLQDRTGALKDFETAIALFPELAEAAKRSARGAFLMASGLVVFFPFNEEPDDAAFVMMRVHLGHMVLAKDSLEAELKRLDEELANHPTDGDLYQQRANLRISYWNFEGALKDVNQAILLQPNKGTLFETRSYLEERLGIATDKYIDLQKAVDLDPTNTFLLLVLANNYFYDNRYEEAAETFGRIVALDPTNHTALNNQATALLRMHDYARGIAALEQLAASRPWDYEPLEQIGLIYCRNGDANHAIDFFIQVRERRPSRTKWHQEVYQRKGFYEGPLDGKRSLALRRAEELYAEAGCPKLAD